VFMQRQKPGSDKRVLFEVNIDDTLLKSEIVTDSFRLEQVISNLLSNAIKFTDEGSIELGCKQLTDAGLLSFM